MSKITTRRLRDYPWNIRLGAIIAAVALIAGSIIISTEAQAAQKAHISIAKARGEIVRYFGPGTVVTKCKQFSPRLVGCDYETPLENVGIVIDEGEGFSPWRGFATVDPRGVHMAGFE